MAMMAKMRSLAPWFIILVGGLFVLFMVISDSNVLEFMGQRSQNVGYIDGEEVSYQEYSSLVERARQNQEQGTGQTIDETQMDFFRDQVWDALVTQKLMDKKIKEFGIVVTDDEIRNSLLGPNPPPMLTQQFMDSTGNFNRQAYDQAMRDPRNKEIVVAVEDQIRQQLIQEKLQNYLFASITVSDEEVKNRFIMQNIKMRADFVQIDPNTIADSEVKYNDADLKKYYDTHLEEYKIEPSRKIKYVLFRRIPSQGDSISIKRNLEAIAAKIKTDTASFKSYIDIYSERPYSRDTLSLTALAPQAKDLFQNAAKGSVVGPVQSNEGYVLYKLFDKIRTKNEVVKASHILVKSTGDDNADLNKANAIYNELIKGADFAELAKQKSEDFGSGSRGGDLGWFGKGQMVKEFEEASYKGAVGVIQKPVKSTFGYHIIKVTGKSNEDYVVESIVNKIDVSATTVDKLFQDAQDFSYIANEKDFESEAKILNYDVVETPPFTEEALAIPGLGMGRAIVKWSFENSKGDVSDVFRVNAGYAVVMVSEEIKAGFKTFEEVKDVVQNGVIREKKFEKAIAVAKEIRTRLGDNGNKNIAREVYSQARVDSTIDYTTFGTVPAIGREYAFTNYSYTAELNKWSQPVKGTLGVYLIYVKYRTKFVDETFAFQKEAIRKEMLQQRKNSYFNTWLQSLKNEVTVEDNRYLFYR